MQPLMGRSRKSNTIKPRLRIRMNITVQKYDIFQRNGVFSPKKNAAFTVIIQIIF